MQRRLLKKVEQNPAWRLKALGAPDKNVVVALVKEYMHQMKKRKPPDLETKLQNLKNDFLKQAERLGVKDEFARCFQLSLGSSPEAGQEIT